MTVEELIKELEEMPKDSQVVALIRHPAFIVQDVRMSDFRDEVILG